jgi:hypothetical protein
MDASCQGCARRAKPLSARIHQRDVVEEASNGRGLLAAFSPTECFQQMVQEYCVAFQYLKSRLGNAKPGRAVELRK